MDDYVMVPREPTKEMLMAADNIEQHMKEAWLWDDVWRAMLAAAPQQQADAVHTCSYYCTRPECIRAQRDELRDRMEATQQAEPVAYLFTDLTRSGNPVERVAFLDDVPSCVTKKGMEPLYISPQPRITAEQVEQIKRLADEYARDVEFDLERKHDTRAALHAALDALVKETR